MGQLIKTYKKIITEKHSEIVPVKVYYIDYNGNKQKGELEVHKNIATDTMAVFKELFDIGFPINKIEPTHNRPDKELIQNNITSAYNYRTIAGTDKLSKHAKGLAIDLNPKVNPARPSSMAEYYDYSTKTGKVTQQIINIFKKHGFKWGGEIFKGFYDSHHFEQ